MSSKLAELLFTEYRRKILGLLLLHPNESYHVREIARLTGTVAGTLHKELSKLADAGILRKQTAGNQVRYQANPACPIYQELRAIMTKAFDTRLEVKQGGNLSDRHRITIGGQLDISRPALQTLVQQFHIRRLYLFGSAARGELKPDSDIDLLVEFEDKRSPSMGGMLALQEAFIKLFHGRNVDIATPSILNNPYRKRAIEKDMEELYAA